MSVDPPAIRHAIVKILADQGPQTLGGLQREIGARLPASHLPSVAVELDNLRRDGFVAGRQLATLTEAGRTYRRAM